MLEGLRGLLDRRKKPQQEGAPCPLADRRTWVDPRIKLHLEGERKWSERESSQVWEVLVWRDGDWRSCAWGRHSVDEAFDFMKEIAAHRLTGPDDPQFFWDISCWRDRELEGRTESRQEKI